MNPLERFLAGHFNAASCLTFARGSTALYSLFCALRKRDGAGEVIIPGICCETVALAALFADLTPVICDVDPRTLCLSTESVHSLLSEKTRAIVIVHIFGCVADTAAFLEMRGERRIVLVEDLAHAAGGHMPDGRPLGSTLDCTLLSFAPDKIINGSGGALVFNDSEELFAITEQERQELPPAPARHLLQQKSLSLRNITHGLFDLHRTAPEACISQAFMSVVWSYRNLIVRIGDAEPSAQIKHEFSSLPANVKARSDRYERYRRGIRRPDAKVAAIPDGSTCWRCPVLFANGQIAQGVTAALRAAGLNASNHYFPLDVLLGQHALPGNSVVGKTIVNLWVNHDTSDAQIDATIALINSFCNPEPTRD